MKGKVAEVLQDDYMSSEESQDEDSTVTFILKTIPWESKKLKKRKEKLDKEYQKHHTTRQTKRSVKRVRKDGVVSLRPKPQDCPSWACVKE